MTDAARKEILEKALDALLPHFSDEVIWQAIEALQAIQNELD